jgi:8-amino-7-oxononanoate synthase
VFVVDEAHSLGVYGKHGRGAGEHLGVEAEIDVIVGTFSKSVGVIGGYAVSNTAALRALRFMARPYLYTASLPLPVVAAAREAIRLIATDEGGLRDRLWRNAHRFHAGIGALGLHLHAAAGPVGSIRLPGMAAGRQFWQALLARGIYVNMLLPPATPDGEVVLRFSVSAAHQPQHIDAAIDAFRDVLRSIDIA